MTSQLSQGFSAHFYLLPGRVLPGHYLSLTPSISFSEAILQTLVYKESYNLRKHFNPLSKSMPNLMKKLLTDKVPPGTA